MLQQAGTRRLLPVLLWLPAQLLKLPANVTGRHILRACVQHVPCKHLNGSTPIRQQLMLLPNPSALIGRSQSSTATRWW